MSIGDVTTTSLTLQQLSLAQSSGTDSPWYLLLPKYQRGVVWSLSQKRKLIESISLGYPFGSLLGYSNGDTRDDSSGKPTRPVIELVDGLQRTSTVVEYMKEPLAFLDAGVVFHDGHVHKLASYVFDSVSDTRLDQVLNRLAAWLDETRVTDRRKGFTERKFLNSLSEIEGARAIPHGLEEEANDLASAILQEIVDMIQSITTVMVPIVIYKGREENIPEIFERINSQGIKLSKYEKFAASWMRFKVEIASPEIRAQIEGKYESLRGRGFEVAELPEGSEAAIEYNLFEYLFGLGKTLAKDFPYLFPASDDPEDAPPQAFVITTVAFGLKIANMIDLAKTAQDRFSNDASVIDLSVYESALRKACEDTESILRPFLKLKLNKQGTKERFLPHSANQLNSLVVRVLLETHDPSSWEPTKSLTMEAKRRLKAHYVYDIISNHWSGSGDSRLFEMCWAEENKQLKTASYYLTPIKREDFDSALKLWHQGQLNKRQKSRSNIQSDAKAVLRLLYASLLTVSDNESQVFDLEHLYPVQDLIEALEAKGDEGWPISALGNLTLLDKDINRIKGKNYLGDYLASDSAREISKKDRELMQLVIGEPELESITRDPQLDLDKYVEFCSSRFDWQRQQLLANLELED